MTKAEIDAKMEDIIEFSEVREFIDTPVKRYSSGMFVKLAFSVAAHLDSEIMIMDEVLAVGDMAFQKKCLDKMRDAAKKEGRTVLYVSHNMNTIRQLCDRCIVLDQGKIIFEGDVESAIGVYMGTTHADAFPVRYNFSGYKRPHHFGQQILVTDFAFIGKNTADFEIGEEIQFEVKYNSKIELAEAYCILRIKDHLNTGKIAGSLSQPFHIDVAEGQVQKFSLQTNELIEDTYCLSFEMIARDGSGNYFSFDNPGAIIPIQLKNCNQDDIVWSKQYWGNVRMQSMQVM